jgi:predicted PurR-regulated permease PerM
MTRIVGPTSVAGQTTRWVMMAVLFIALLLALWAISGILLLALTAVVLVVLITTPVRFLMRRGMGRGPATALSLLAFMVFILIVVLAVVPLLSRQFVTLADRAQKGVVEIVDSWVFLDPQPENVFLGWSMPVPIEPPREPVTEVLRLLRDSFQLDADLIQQIGTQILNALQQLSVSVVPVVSGVASTFLNILIVIFLSIYFMTNPTGYENGVIRLLPIFYRQRGREIIDRLDLALRGWLESTLLAMVFVGVATWIGLGMLGLAEAAALGVVAGLLAFVPTFGTLVAAVLAVAVGIIQEPQNVGLIILVTYFISLVQSQVISPLLVAGRINLPPALVLLGQIIFGLLFGFLGLLLAVPLAAILMVIVQEVYIKDILGDATVSAPETTAAALLPRLTDDPTRDEGLMTTDRA